MKTLKLFLLTGILLFTGQILFSQRDTLATDSISNQDQIYNRPFIYLGKTTTAVGGYLEGNTNYWVEDGIREGLSFEMRRFNIFLYSTIAKRIRFLSELEFEHGTREINVETALIDVEIFPELVFRGGILMPPIAGFNVNHDSPKWEFVERPLVSTHIIPSTLSEIGFGFNGKRLINSLMLTYDLYLVNGLGSGIILNQDNRTSLQFGKHDALFEEDNNGTPTLTGRLGMRLIGKGEMGLSFYTGPYNNFRKEGDLVDERRDVTILGLDFETGIGDLTIQGEGAYAMIQVPESLGELYADKQLGGFVDFIYPVLQRKVLIWDNAVVNLSARVEGVDLNMGEFSSTGLNIGDEEIAVSGGLAFRPSPVTIFRLNYRYHWITDILGNDPAKRAGIQFGFASYF